jgi:predicted Zn-dependent peptidase
MKALLAEHRLPNGLRIVVESLPRVRSAAVGWLVRTGARHEAPDEHGVSHFLEHMCFKGTARRSSQQINIRFDELGSIYNAFTGKEHTIYYGWVPAARLEAQLELLADMMRPSLPPEEFETERQVILEEIAQSGDSFEHHVWNFLHASAFAGTPLSHEVLGERETIAALPRERMSLYHQHRYTPHNMTLLASGNVDPQAFFAAAGRFCGWWEQQGLFGPRATPEDSGDGHGQAGRPVPVVPTGTRSLRLEQFCQQTVMLVYPSVSHRDPRAEAIEAFTQIFGGANSRCYWNIVQKGVCTSAGAAWVAYEDCGLMVLYAQGEPQRCEEMVAALREQARQISEIGVRPDELARVKNQRRTQLALESENPRTRLMQMADDIETHGSVRTAGEQLAAVEAVTPDDIAAYLGSLPITGEGLLLSCGPRAWP